MFQDFFTQNVFGKHPKWLATAPPVHQHIFFPTRPEASHVLLHECDGFRYQETSHIGTRNNITG